MLFVLGYLIQRQLINKVVAAPIFITFTLTFGLDLLHAKRDVADGKRHTAVAAAGLRQLHYWPASAFRVARLGAMALALLLTGLLYWLLKRSSIGRAIVAVRMDRHAATLLGIEVPQIYAITFGVGALMAAAAGGAMAMIYPITPLLDGPFLGKAFVICVLGGLGSVPGALVGGLVLGLLESFGALTFGSQWSATVGFAVMLAILVLQADWPRRQSRIRMTMPKSKPRP